MIEFPQPALSFTDLTGRLWLMHKYAEIFASYVEGAFKLANVLLYRIWLNPYMLYLRTYLPAEVLWTLKILLIFISGSLSLL